MIDVLLDTNIVIYLVQQDKTCLKFLETLREKHLGISVITHMELLIGVKSDAETAALQSILSRFEIVPLGEEIARRSVITLRTRTHKNIRDPRLADTVIAHTALLLNVPLATNNAKDFKKFPSLTILTPRR